MREPEDIASAVAWRIKGGEGATGQVLVVDAGAALGAQKMTGRLSR
jgi:hypothetical protein